MIAERIPEIMSLAPPATREQIDALETTLGLKLPDEYRQLLAEANGINASLVTIYPADCVPERNETYEVAKYAPGHILIGTVNCFPVLLTAGQNSAVYENGWGAMTPDFMRQLATSLFAWIEVGCLDSEALADKSCD